MSLKYSCCGLMVILLLGIPILSSGQAQAQSDRQRLERMLQEGLREADAIDRESKKLHLEMVKSFNSQVSSAIADIQQLGCNQAVYDDFDNRLIPKFREGMKDLLSHADRLNKRPPSDNPDVQRQLVRSVNRSLRQFDERAAVMADGVLAFADASLAKGCLRFADAQYRAVLKMNLVQYHPRALVGIADVRERNRR